MRLADVLARRRKVDESAAIAARAATTAADLGSRRVTQGLRAIARDLAPFRHDPGVGSHLEVIHAALPA